MTALENAKIKVLKNMIDSIYKLLCDFKEGGNIIPKELLYDVLSELSSADELYFHGELGYAIVQLNRLNQHQIFNHKDVRKITLDCANTLCRLRDVILNG